MPTKQVNAEQFYCLFYTLLHKIYGAQEVWLKMSKRELFGYEGEKNKPDYKNSINGIAKLSSNRFLYNKVIEFNKLYSKRGNGDFDMSIKISNNNIQDCLSYLRQYHYSGTRLTLEDVVSDYKKSHTPFSISTIKLKGDRGFYPTAVGNTGVEIHSNLRKLGKDNWSIYFFLPQEGHDVHPDLNVYRLAFELEQVDSPVVIQMTRKEDIKYSGQIIHSSERSFSLEVNEQTLRLYLQFSIDEEGELDFYLGIFLWDQKFTESRFVGQAIMEKHHATEPGLNRNSNNSSIQLDLLEMLRSELTQPIKLPNSVGKSALEHWKNQHLESHYRPNLKNLVGLYHMYQYEYKESDNRYPRLMQFGIKIYQEGLDYKIHLINKPTFSDFFGTVIESKDNMVIFRLKGKEHKTTMFIMLRVEESGKKPICIGTLNKYNAGMSLYCCSIILQRVNKKEDFKGPMVFQHGDTEITAIDQGIRLFFYGKNYNYIHPPKHFELDTLLSWIKKKKEDRNEIKVYDFYLSVPILSIARKHKVAQRTIDMAKNIANRKIKSLDSSTFLQKYRLKGEEAASVKAILEELKDELATGLGKIMLPDEYRNIPYNHNRIHDDVIDLKNELIEKFKHVGIENVYYPQEKRKEVAQKTARIIMEEDWEALSKSRLFLLINLHENLPSSCWVLTGIALALGIPTFIASYGKDSLPFNLRGVDQVKHLRDQVEMKTINPNLTFTEEIIEWFVNSNFDLRYFAKRII